MTLSLPLYSSDTRQRIELEYGWQLLLDRSGRMLRETAEQSNDWRNARVGLSWNVQFEDLRDYMGAAWYRTSFELNRFLDTRHVLLKFGAVDYFCEVFLNGLSIGTHEGGYTPFSFEVTSAVHAGVNQLLIRVIDPPMDLAENRALFPEMMYNEIPHGKQNWYVQNSGIWQGVRLELCPSIYIERLDVVSRINGQFELTARLAGVGLTAKEGETAEATTLQIEIFDATGRTVFVSSQGVATDSHTMSVQGQIEHPELWSAETPALYVISATLMGGVQYHRRTRFGFRSFEARDGRLYLNGNPFYMMAALDQDFYPETVHTPTSVEFVREMMVKAKALGVNMLRCHLKVAHPVYLDVADELGLLVWTELPSWSDCWFPADHFSTMAAVRAEKMFWEILIRDWNHPCIVLQTIMNESWGIDLKDASQRAWLRAMIDRIKGLLTPLGRLVIDNSPCEGNFHIKTDIEDFHQYYSMPDQAENWDRWLNELSLHPAWTFSPHGDAERSGQEPLVVSEFGNWGLPKLPRQLPWWFENSFGEREVTRPKGVLDRFHLYGFDKLFASFNEMAEETQWHQFTSLKYEIESIRSYDSVQGYVVTGITDVHWEVNGLLDMWRNEKVYANKLSSLQRPDLIMCKLPAYCFRGGSTVDVPILFSHFSDEDLRGAKVRWSTEGGAGGQFTLQTAIARGSVARLQPIRLELPRVDRPTTERLEIEIRRPNGHRISENSYDLFLLPPPIGDERAQVHVQRDRLESLRAGLAHAGYVMTDRLEPNMLLIVDHYDEYAASHVQNGGNALLVVNSENALPHTWPIKVSFRKGTELDGRWFSNFNWIRPDRQPFSRVAFTRILGFESASVAPEYVIEGIGPDMVGDVLSGITFGWLNRNCALAAQMRVGRGKIVITTYRFDKYASDAYSMDLLDSLILYASSSDLQPQLDLPVPIQTVSE